MPKKAFHREGRDGYQDKTKQRLNVEIPRQTEWLDQVAKALEFLRVPCVLCG
jgi:hypothetical protein